MLTVAPLFKVTFDRDEISIARLTLALSSEVRWSAGIISLRSILVLATARRPPAYSINSDNESVSINSKNPDRIASPLTSTLVVITGTWITSPSNILTFEKSFFPFVKNA